jgi:hypothetical protein
MIDLPPAALDKPRIRPSASTIRHTGQGASRRKESMFGDYLFYVLIGLIIIMSYTQK